MSSFLGIVSTLKANNSIQIINFSNRFSMTDMSLTLSFNPPVVDNGISPPAVRSFECSSQPCSPDVALAGLQLATPTAPAVTSIPASDDNLSDILVSDSDIFSFEVVFVTLGVAGGLFTISCLAKFILSGEESMEMETCCTSLKSQGYAPIITSVKLLRAGSWQYNIKGISREQ
jgi:hypothetical protein